MENEDQMGKQPSLAQPVKEPEVWRDDDFEDPKVFIIRRESHRVEEFQVRKQGGQRHGSSLERSVLRLCGMASIVGLLLALIGILLIAPGVAQATVEVGPYTIKSTSVGLISLFLGFVLAYDAIRRGIKVLKNTAS